MLNFNFPRFDFQLISIVERKAKSIYGFFFDKNNCFLVTNKKYKKTSKTSKQVLNPSYEAIIRQREA